MENNIINNINSIAENLFKSVEGQVFKTLDDITIITDEILKIEPLKNLFFQDKINGIILIANSLILFYIVYYVFFEVFSMYNGNKNSNIYVFIIRIVFVLLIVNSSYFVCEQILNVFSILTETIDLFFKTVTKEAITFVNLKENIISMEEFMSSDILSLNGIIKGVISFGAFSILINFAIRYVTIIFLIIISPFAFLSLSSDLTSGFFISWWKMFITNLSIQLIIKFFLFIPILYKDTNNIMYKIVLVGSIYLIYKLNTFIKEILTKVTLNIKLFDIIK